MTGHETDANLFALPDFAQKSQWLQDLATDPQADLFALHSNDDETLSAIPHSFSVPDALVAEPNDLFKPPPALDHYPVTIDPEPPVEEEASITSGSVADPVSDADTWMDLDEPAVPTPLHRTWHAFETGKTQPREPLFLSEAGAAAYDALLSWPTDPLHLHNAHVPVVETRAYFASLLSLSLGRESLLFVRNDTAKAFRPTLAQFRISGYSRHVLLSVQEECLACGIRMLQLRSFIHKSYTAESSPCRVALASAVSQVVQVVHKYVTVDRAQPPSLLQLQDTIACLAAIVKPLVKLQEQLRSDMGDDDILSLVFFHASQADADSRHIRDMMRELLQRVSTPWIEFLQEWIGIRPEQGIPLSKTNVGARKWFVKVDCEIYVDDFGRQVQHVDFALDRKRMPSFIPDDVAQSIFETGKNLRFIKSHHPKHVLASTQTTRLQTPPEAKWLFDWNAISRMHRRIQKYGNRMEAIVDKYRLGHFVEPLSLHQDSSKKQEEHKLVFFGVDEQEMESRIQASMERMQQSLRDETAQDSLAKIVRRQLQQQQHGHSAGNSLTPHWSLLPLLSFGTMAAAQARLIDQEHMRLLFSQHDLLAHLGLYRQFYMLGNGLFCTRLSQALFHPDLESAEREAGVARQGGVMGLRLGGRDTWPPASSELRLALMGILTDAYLDQLSESATTRKKKKKKKKKKAGPEDERVVGNLSFSVRDLSAEEIDRCMDPDSLEALDFLCLRYTTPPALTSVITPVVLLQYDEIFRLLLRVLRMMYVVDELFRHQTLGRRRRRGHDGCEKLPDEVYRFVREARIFVSSVAGYFLDTAISIPWRAFEGGLRQMQQQVHFLRAQRDSAGARGSSSSSKQTMTMPSPLLLQQMHCRAVRAIMSGLFLRKRQQPILNLLEDIFSGILQYAKVSKAYSSSAASSAPPPDDGGEARQAATAAEMYDDFRQKVGVFIRVCRSLAEKAAAGDELFMSAGMGDESLVAQLLSKLDLDHFYVD